MATFTKVKTYADNTVLTEAQLDAAFNAISTFVSTTKLMSDNINDNTFTSSKFVNSNVTTAKLADNSVTSDKLDSSTVTDFDRAVGTDHIQDAQVTAAKVADNAITRAKLSAFNSHTSSACGSFSTTTSGSEVVITNLSHSLTVSSGATVITCLTPDPAITTTGVTGSVQLSPVSASFTAELRLYRDTTMLASWEMRNATGFSYLQASQPLFIDTSVSAGAHTYEWRVIKTVGGGSDAISATNLKAYALEL